MSAEWDDALHRARTHAPFLSDLLGREEDIAALLARGEAEAALKLALARGDPDVCVRLRRQRRALALVLGVGDLAGAFPLSRVMAELSDFADRALDTAMRDAVGSRVPDHDVWGDAPIGMVALALGKQGAGELNYSSDIDPILLYDPRTIPRRDRDEPAEAAQMAARRLVQTMGSATAEGYVLRVDLRLRPASEVSPLAISYDAALTHYESSALAWERAAFIRARSASGDVAAGERFLHAIRSFVWRKSLDFGAIDEISRLVRRIRESYDGPPRPGPGYDLKRGRGGIREVEFYAQTHQLIHGGRIPELRVRGTRQALDALAQAGIIGAADAQELGESYDRLRVIEHRLQMVRDRQTHALPAAAEEMDNVARLDGLADGAALVAELDDVTTRVAERFDHLLEMHGGKAQPAASAPAHLAQLGFDEPAALAERIAGWKDGRVKSLRSDAALAAFAEIEPALLAALAAAPMPERAITRWEQMLARLPSAFNLFKLLAARPGLLDTLARVLALSPALADALARRSDLLDALIDRTAFALPPPVEALKREYHADAPNYERLLDRVRREVSERRFALGVQLIDHAHDPLEIAAGLSRTAEAAIDVLAGAAADNFAEEHGRIEGGQLVVLGFGRLGGGVLTHASDLDLVYLFTGDYAAESRGRRPLGATQYFNRLAQRVSAALSVPTAEGALYEVDTRLRPSGAQGLLAVSTDSFARYQREQAWTWEHMALMRARVLHGPPEAPGVLAGFVRDLVAMKRDPAALKGAVLEMRAEMARHKPPAGPLDVKLLRGGLVDLEFLTHYLQLREGGGPDGAFLDPHLRAAVDALAGAGLVSGDLVAAHDLLTRLLVSLRLVAPDGMELPEAARGVLVANCLEADCREEDGWDALLAALDKARHAVAQAWAKTFDETLEL
ncbi:bifunctional [glutamate--ammonia ligase]-adenylyl-L-tyrosine phosphorylase/[glutamate--ammonia-ligase] adenylyltransferase [Croceicoccus marinus]|uniref:Bifunctional [glutamate--ammonia ligase]-adenylyl-L-tyrosine phosphorylase/[glutamate--ammonia-ligase] adenylyltransferase n=1 Tax=Croceicoccus marinus TaxID=450378 RepID=A0A7G6VVP7_9SPHN|nr:bifunctional [glutamate--ammonia ligase]-adenylyl-L-tyrosine phosphorylase/[glutamate--ammonia-ligase] adenylyltransferase [Croceicoccus marinus]QNE05812.1 bifunctional [glutamate--ammonia ligase]-adenylyl-L-tyrosine phosphorylase/[glutamate--ammonia-ligase] adenylyltransferase [Croceicoccus marinus]